MHIFSPEKSKKGIEIEEKNIKIKSNIFMMMGIDDELKPL